MLNDVASNFLLLNDGSGHFEDVGLLSGAACNANGDELGSMGVDCGDYDGDGHLDFFMTSYQNELPVLYRNIDGVNFEDVTAQVGAGEGAYNHVNWGTGFVDFDNDADLDLFLACGHLQDNIEQFDSSSSHAAKDIVLMNTDGMFTNVSEACADGSLPSRSSRGAAFDDIDRDGDIDAVILNSRTSPTLLKNELAKKSHWLRIRLIGTEANRDAVGARVRLTAGGKTQIAEVHAGRGYQSHWGASLFFGLGESDQVERLEVRWSDGASTTYEPIAIDGEISIRQGSENLFYMPRRFSN